jgi:general secretion pathway protein L
MEYLIINIAEQQVMAARFDISGSTAAVGGAASFLLDDETNLAAVVAKIAEGSSGSPRVVVCLPPSLFAQRVVELPLTDLRKVREILPAHLQGEIALPAEEAVFDALAAADGTYLALWAKRSEIAQAIDVFREAGCEPQIVSSAPFAWPFLPGVQPDCALCDGAALAVIAEGRLAFVRALDGADPHRQLRATLSALELAGTHMPQRLFVFGEQAQSLAGMGDLPLQVEPLLLPDDLVPIFRTEDTFQQLAGLYAVARACHAGALPDFRRGDLAWTTGDARLRRKLILTAILLALTVVLLFVSKGLQYRSARTDIASLNVSISSIYREIFPTRTKAVDELSEVKGEIKKLTGSENSSSVLDVLRQLAEAKGTAINGLFEAELDGRTLRVKGDARSAQSVNDFKAALSGLMATVEVGEIKSRPDGTVGFSLSGTLKEGAK